MLTWQRIDADTLQCLSYTGNRRYVIRRERSRWTLYLYNGTDERAVCRGGLKVCQGFASDIAAGRLVPAPSGSGNWVAPQRDKAMEDRAIKALQCTWRTIGPDTMRALSETGQLDRNPTVDRETVIDAVSSCGFVGGYPETYGKDAEAVQWLENLASEEQDYVLRLAFPHVTYGR